MVRAGTDEGRPRARRDGAGWRIPRLVLALLLSDLVLIGLYLGDAASGGALGPNVDLNREGNLPTRFAAGQLATVAVVFGVVALRWFDPREPRTWLLWGLPLLFSVLALDELMRFHERAGLWLDELPGADRRELPLRRTGIWMFAIGVPFVVGLAGYFRLVRSFFGRRALTLAGVGFAVFMGGAIGFETFANFVDSGSREETIQVLAEEGSELVGVTVILWGAYVAAFSSGAR